MSTQNDVGALLRASTRTRTASFRDMAKMVTGGASLVGPAKAAIDDAQRLRAPLAESGTEVLIRADRKRRGEASIGNEVEDGIIALRPAWDTLKADIATARAAGTVTQGFQSAFGRDYAAWAAFANAHAHDWAALRTELARIETYRQTLERWRAAFIAAGGTPTGTPTTAPPEGLVQATTDALGGATGIREAADRAASTVNTVAVVAGVVAVAGVIGLLVYEGGGIARRLT